MSQQHIDLWRQAADAFDQRYNAIGDDQWQQATPCTEWQVRQLVDHAVGVQQSLGGNTVGADIEEGADWPATRDAIDAALATEGALDGTTEHPAFGEVPKAMMIGIGTSDLLLHTWDLARAIGADEALPAEAVSACYAGLQQLPEEVRLAPGRFGSPIEPPADADEQTRLLLFSGRQV